MLAAGGWTRSGQVCRIHDFRVAFLCCKKKRQKEDGRGDVSRGAWGLQERKAEGENCGKCCTGCIRDLRHSSCAFERSPGVAARPAIGWAGERSADEPATLSDWPLRTPVFESWSVSDLRLCIFCGWSFLCLPALQLLTAFIHVPLPACVSRRVYGQYRPHQYGPAF